jgi:hypothetical protein
MPYPAALCILVLLCLPLASQSQLLLPAAASPTAAGNGSDQLGWTVPPFGWAGLRGQIVLSAANFTARGIGGPVDLSRVRLRAAGTGGAVTIPGASLALGTSAVPYGAISLNYASQIGPDFVTVFTGTIQVAAVPTFGAVGPWHVDIPFAVPFRYDPTQGDLLVELRYPSASMSGNFPAPPNDMIVGASALGASIAGSSTSPFATYRLNQAVQVLEFDYVPAPGAASAFAHGVGCPHRRASLFELFYGPFDLGGTPSVANVTRFVRLADGYAVTRTTGTFATGGQVPLGIGDGSTQVVGLPFVFPYAAADGTLRQTTSIEVADNGYLWLDPATAAGSMAPAVASQFCSFGARIAAAWVDLDPSQGTIAAGVVGGAVVVTWDQVPEAGGNGVVRAQIVLRTNGDFDLVHADMSGLLTQPAVVGFAPGFALLAESRDLSLVLPLTTRPEVDPLRLTAAERPVLGATMHLDLANAPPATLLGAVVISLSSAALPLDGIGMAGCTQYVGLDVAHLLFGPGNGTVHGFAVPGDVGFVGLPLHFQAALFAAGFNALGVIASNGVATVVGSF